MNQLASLINLSHKQTCINRLHGRVAKGVGHLGYDEAMEAGGREFSIHGQVVKGVGHLDHDEAMKAGGREFSLHGRVVKVKRKGTPLWVHTA